MQIYMQCFITNHECIILFLKVRTMTVLIIIFIILQEPNTLRSTLQQCTLTPNEKQLHVQTVSILRSTIFITSCKSCSKHLKQKIMTNLSQPKTSKQLKKPISQYKTFKSKSSQSKINTFKLHGNTMLFGRIQLLY